MATVTEDQVRAALATITDSEGGGDLISLGMVSGLVIKDGNVGFSIEVDPAEGEKMEPLRKLAEQTIHALPGVVSVTAVLTAHRQSPGDGQGAGRSDGQGNGSGAAPQQAARPEGQPADAIVAVASGKGGVGKSTTAINIALALAAEGKSVGILDADVYGPSMPRMMGISGKPTSPDGKILDPMENYGVKVMSMGFMVEEETPMIWRGPMVQSALQQMLKDVDWGPLDILIVDMPPGTGDAQLTLAQQVPLAGAVIVSTPQDIALIDARKGLNMFRKVDVPVLGIVENMSYYLCPSCGERAEIFGHGGAKEDAERMGVPFLGEIPLHISIRERSDEGHPIVVAEPESAYTEAYRKIAKNILGTLESSAASQRAAPKIVVQ